MKLFATAFLLLVTLLSVAVLAESFDAEIGSFGNSRQATNDGTAVFTVHVNSSKCDISGGVGGIVCQQRFSNVISVVIGAILSNVTDPSVCVPQANVQVVQLNNGTSSVGLTSVMKASFSGSNNSVPTACVDNLSPRTSNVMAQAFVTAVTNGANNTEAVYIVTTPFNETFYFFKASFPISNPSELTSTAQVFADASESSGADVALIGGIVGGVMGCILLCCLCLLSPFIIIFLVLGLIVLLVILLLPCIVIFCVVAIVLLVVVVGAVALVGGVGMLIVGFTLRKTVYKKRLAAQGGDGMERPDDFGTPGFDDDL